MLVHQHNLTIPTRGRGTYEITSQLHTQVRSSNVTQGLAHLFIHHTSASLIITENADPDVRHDLETIFARLAPDGDPSFRHAAEGPDDMSAHVRAALTQTHLSIPITQGRCNLGTWQGVFVWEHRTHPHQRRLTLTIIGS